MRQLLTQSYSRLKARLASHRTPASASTPAPAETPAKTEPLGSKRCHWPFTSLVVLSDLTTVCECTDGFKNRVTGNLAFNSVQDHVLHAASAHIDRIVFESFAAGIDACTDPETREIFGLVCDLYALSVIEEDKAWYIEHRFLSMDRAKAVTAGINDRCRKLRPYAEVLVDGFGIPEQLRYAEMLHPERIPEI